jgi:hypothetical protein
MEQLDRFKCLAQLSDKVRFVCGQLERGASGTPHIQGYIELHSRTRIGGLRDILQAPAHMEVRRGSQRQAIMYCTKPETRLEGPFYDGTPYRCSLEDIAGQIRMHRLTPRQLALEEPMMFMRHHNASRALFNAVQEHRHHPMRVLILFGDTGTGKSAWARQKFPDAYYAPWPTGGRWWWPEYEHQETVVLDEFRHQIKYDVMLKLFDRYPMWVESKGSNHKMNSKRIVITTNLHPKDWYGGVKDKDPLKRRIKEYAKVTEFVGRPVVQNGSVIPYTRSLDLNDFEFNEYVDNLII